MFEHYPKELKATEEWSRYLLRFLDWLETREFSFHSICQERYALYVLPRDRLNIRDWILNCRNGAPLVQQDFPTSCFSSLDPPAICSTGLSRGEGAAAKGWKSSPNWTPLAQAEATLVCARSD